MATAARRDPFWKATHESADSVERAIDLAVRREVRELQKRGFGELEKRLKAGRGVRSAAALDWKSFESGVADALEERMLRAADSAGKRAAARVGTDLPRERIAAEVRRRARRSARIIRRNTRAGVEQAIRAARLEGFTARQTRDLVRATVGMTKQQAGALIRRTARAVDAGELGMGSAMRRVTKTAQSRLRNRAAGIGRNEGLAAAQLGMDEVFADAEAGGTVEAVQKGWVTLRDGNQDPICDRLHGQRVPLRSKFVDPGTGAEYGGPPDPHNVCRCGVHYFFVKPRAAVEIVYGPFVPTKEETFVGIEPRRH